MMSDRNSVVCTFKNGSVGVFSLGKKKLEFVTEPGHSETIFDLAIKSDDPNLYASASYDGTIKIWDCRTVKHIETLSSDMLEGG